LAKLNLAANKNMGVIAAGRGLQTEEVTEERKRRRNSKKSFTKINKNRKMNDSIGSKMVQTNPKITEKSMKKRQNSMKEDSGMKEQYSRTSIFERIYQHCTTHEQTIFTLNHHHTTTSDNSRLPENMPRSSSF